LNNSKFRISPDRVVAAIKAWDHCAMVSRDLHDLLIILYDAGARSVPAEEIAWTSDMSPILNHALNMQYIVYREGKRGRRFSLTKAGYMAIGKRPPDYTSLSSIFSAFFGRRA
jgi:hypothetical protein